MHKINLALFFFVILLSVIASPSRTKDTLTTQIKLQPNRQRMLLSNISITHQQVEPVLGSGIGCIAGALIVPCLPPSPCLKIVSCSLTIACGYVAGKICTFFN